MTIDARRLIAEEWRRRAQRWIDAGIVTPEQAQQIADIEGARSEATAHEIQSASGREGPSPWMEVVAYFGVVLAGVSAFLFVGSFWNGLAIGWRLAVGGALSVVGLVGGHTARRASYSAGERLGGVLFLLGTIGVALAVGVGADRIDQRRAGVTALCVGVAVLALSVTLWRNRDRAFQFLSGLVGAVMTVVGVAVVTGLHTTAIERELAAWIAGTGLVALGYRRLRPSATVVIVGEVGAIVAALAMTFSTHVVGIAFALVTTTAATALGLALKRAPVAGVAVIGYFMLVIRIFALYLRGTGAIAVALALGLFLVVVSVWLAHRNDHLQEGSRAKTFHLFHHDESSGAPER